MRKWFYALICFSISCVCIMAQGGPGSSGTPPPCPGGPPCDVDDVLPLEHDLLMIFLGVGLAILYFKFRPLFWGKKSNS
jgi:hypothetical protein